jgi:hypothetical protein
LRSMVDDLIADVQSAKINDLLHRLDHENTSVALATEAELSMLWAISRVAHLLVEPKLPNSTRRPDAFSKNLLRSGPAVIEVRALSDDSFSGKEASHPVRKASFTSISPLSALFVFHTKLSHSV